MRVGQGLQVHQEKITKKYKNMYRILSKIKIILSGWEPSDIFHDGNREYYEHDTPITGFFWSSCDCSYDNYKYTKLGHWFEDVPDIVSLLKLFWYIPAWIVYIVVNIVWFIIELFLPSSVKAWL